MPLGLSQLPSDIILEIVTCLDLPDVVSLVLVRFQLLSTQRSFWISVLETTRRTYPLACSPDADLSRFTLEALKQLASSYQKLQLNWKRAEPQLVRAMVSNPLPDSEPAKFLVNIQGTDVFVLEKGTQVFCWNYKLAQLSPFPPVEVGYIQLLFPTQHPGICSVCVLAQNASSLQTSVLTITHELGKVTSFTSEVFEAPVLEGDLRSLFAIEGVVGLIQLVEAQSYSTISFCSTRDIEPRLYHTLKLPRSMSTSMDLLSDCITYKGHLYSLIEDGYSVQIQHVSRKDLVSGYCRSAGEYSCDIVPPPLVIGTAVCSMTSSTASYGLCAVFVRVERDDEKNMNCTSFTFVPTSLTHSVDDGLSSPLAFDSPCVTHRVDGILEDVNIAWLGNNGLAVVTDLPTQPHKLTLLRYHPVDKSVSQHLLNVPENLDLSILEAICVDEATGSLYLTTQDGLFSTLEYV
ncbi:F-box domain-containing protein [Favolaschia claudopus]|uniref:F-box domain-containing protein n=1 Tax=Favolaschia claudopus TaxID=2862362 RepID=A0AAW0DZV9_9AGAR